MEWLLFIAVWMVANCAGLILHELGHLGAACWLGWKPLSVSIGRGHELAAFQRRDLRFILGANPFYGCVRAVALRRAGFRRKLLVYTAAGPAVTMLALCLLVWGWCSLPDGRFPRLETGLVIAAFTQGLMLCGSLWPHYVRMGNETLPNDMLQMWKAVRMRPSDADGAFTGHVLTLALIRLEQGRVTEAMAVIERLGECFDLAEVSTMRMRLLLEKKMEKEADAEWSRAEAADHLDAQAKSRVLDGLACIPLFYGYERLLARAFASIEQAILLAPNEITLKGTKGSLLVEQGLVEEAVLLLEEVSRSTESDNDRAICSYYLALAAYKRGNLPEAVRRYREASVKFSHCVVASRIGKIIMGPG